MFTVRQFMAKKTAPLIKWPDRDPLYKTMPLAFWKLEIRDAML